MSLINKILQNLAKIPVGCRATSKMQSLNTQPLIYNVNDEHSMALAAGCLKSGSVIALPTDTVYGLACDANNEDAIQLLYKIKGREFHKPVAICVKDLSALRKYGRAEHLNDGLLEHLLPGPITVVVERSENLSNPFLNPNTNKIGIRIPEFNFIRQLCGIFNEQPLALTSANRSAEPSSLRISEFECLWPYLGGIVDAGPIGLTEERRSASTVVDLSMPGLYKIVRKGVALKHTLDILHRYGLRPYESAV